MGKTPLQEAIQYWNDRMAEAGTAQLRQAAALFVHYLEAMLEKEKEFVGKVFEAGCEYGDANCEFGGNTALPNRIQFINQLYPEK